MNGPIRINAWLEVPASDLEVDFSRSSGPGGQHVQTTDSRARLRFKLSTTTALSEPVKARLREQRKSWLTNDGDLLVTCDLHRSQHQNLEEVRERLTDAIAAALVPPRPRRDTKPTRGSVVRRLGVKKQRATVKKGRGRVGSDE